MRWLTDLRERLASLLFRGREERDLSEELDFHLAMEQAANEERGMSAAEARRLALLKLGGVERTREEVRDARGVRPLEDLVRDVRFAFRSFGRSRAFTVTAVLVLGLGIGANTAIFSAVRAVILEPLPFSDPASLYMLWESNPEMGWEQATASAANYLDWKERVSSFADVEAYDGSPRRESRYRNEISFANHHVSRFAVRVAPRATPAALRRPARRRTARPLRRPV